jgi:acyl carrier protein
MEVNERIRSVLDQHGRLSVPSSQLDDDEDLYSRGLSSHSSVNVMLALEEAFGVEFPDNLLRRSTFQSVSSIRECLARIGETEAD